MKAQSIVRRLAGAWSVCSARGDDMETRKLGSEQGVPMCGLGLEVTSDHHARGEGVGRAGSPQHQLLVALGPGLRAVEVDARHGEVAQALSVREGQGDAVRLRRAHSVRPRPGRGSDTHPTPTQNGDPARGPVARG